MYKRYNKKYDYSYTLGGYPTVELLKYRSETVQEVIFHSRFTDEDNEGYRFIKELTEKSSISAQTNDRLVEKLASKSSTLVIAIFKKYVQKLTENNHIVLVNPANSGNLGTIIRTMHAFRHHDLAIIAPAADHFLPETIRSSMGSLFSIRIASFAKIEDYAELFSQHNRYVLMTDGSRSLQDINFTNPYSVIFGNESNGLPQEYSELGEAVRIDQSDGVDSLNLAVSAGIVLHHLYQS